MIRTFPSDQLYIPLAPCLCYDALLVLSPFSNVRSADGDDEEEVVHMGNAIMSFYSALIDLLGRCAPEMHVCLFRNCEFFKITFLGDIFHYFHFFPPSLAHQQGEG